MIMVMLNSDTCYPYMVWGFIHVSLTITLTECEIFHCYCSLALSPRYCPKPLEKRPEIRLLNCGGGLAVWQEQMMYWNTGSMDMFNVGLICTKRYITRKHYFRDMQIQYLTLNKCMCNVYILIWCMFDNVKCCAIFVKCSPMSYIISFNSFICASRFTFWWWLATSDHWPHM